MVKAVERESNTETRWYAFVALVVVACIIAITMIAERAA